MNNPRLRGSFGAWFRFSAVLLLCALSPIPRPAHGQNVGSFLWCCSAIEVARFVDDRLPRSLFCFGYPSHHNFRIQIGSGEMSTPHDITTLQQHAEMAAAAAVPSTLNRQCGYPSCSENALRGRGEFGFLFEFGYRPKMCFSSFVRWNRIDTGIMRYPIQCHNCSLLHLFVLKTFRRSLRPALGGSSGHRGPSC